MADIFGVEEDLFSVFSGKAQTSSKTKNETDEKAAAEPSGKKRGANDTAATEKLELQEQSKRQKNDDRDDDAHDDGKDSARDGDLCPAAGPGSVQIHDITPADVDTGRKAHRHHVAVPPNMTIEEVLRPTPAIPPAKEYSFQLDPFQAAAVKCLERGQSVLVSAHTSAGKTAVAEYAIAMALRDKQRVVYTSPIKALSNQKFRELTDEFQDVGLMTGDVTINPEASLLVMTTEILRSMLYRGSELVREMVWIIYDEIHYMRDRDRGVVWEESIVLVPHAARFVFLSATIPNAPDFASWVARVHRQPCHVVYTDYRPTPLQHYMFPAGGDGLHLVVDADGAFREDNFHKCLARLDSSAANTEIAARKKTQGGKGGKGQQKGGADIYRIIKQIMERQYDPTIVFCFSKKDCEAIALQMSKVDFNSDEERANIEMIYTSAMESLSEDDRKLPAVEGILPLLKRGIGIHHSGLLPIIKEATEILFQEGLIKCLCATETFSMGLNMPAKTVVFTGVRKFDGQNFRWLSGGEYIQMSGRAGRRGLDDMGITILMVDEKMEPQVAKDMVKGKADPLNSSFRLGYTMLLNLLLFEGADPEFLIRRSFYQFQLDRQRPQLDEDIATLEKERAALLAGEERGVAELHELRGQLRAAEDQVLSVVLQPSHVLPFLNPGRLVRVAGPDGRDWGWGVLVSYHRRKTGPKAAAAAPAPGDKAAQYNIDVLLPCAPSPRGKAADGPGLAGEVFRPPEEGGAKPEVQVVRMDLSMVRKISSIRVAIPQDLRNADSRGGVGKTVAEVERRFAGEGLPPLDPVEDMDIADKAFKKAVKRLAELDKRVRAHPLQKDPRLAELEARHGRRLGVEAELAALKRRARASGGMAFRSELRSMKRVLRRLGCTDGSDAVQLKGRAACEVDCGDELVITELVFDGVFNDLAPDLCAGLLSCFVFDEATEEGATSVPEELQRPLLTLRDKARRVATVENESRLAVDVEEYVAKFKVGLMEVVVLWCRGSKFSDIMKRASVFEGSVIRCIRRLDELVVSLSSMCKVMGNAELGAKFLEASRLMRRDIVFAASLYL